MQYEKELADLFGDDKATFFLNGNNYECIYDNVEAIRAVHAAGHTLGSHSWSHADFNTLTWDQIHDELWKVELAFERILGVKPIYFRPPYGNYNSLVLAALENRGYKKLVYWSDDAKDGDNSSVDSQLAQYDGFVSSYPNPHLMLQHSTKESTVHQTIPAALAKLRATGYKIVSLDTCMGSQGEWPYTYVGPPGVQDASWTC